jgi:hypothetical protein
MVTPGYVVNKYLLKLTLLWQKCIFNKIRLHCMSIDAQNLSNLGNLTTDVYHQIQIPSYKIHMLRQS